MEDQLFESVSQPCHVIWSCKHVRFTTDNGGWNGDFVKLNVWWMLSSIYLSVMKTIVKQSKTLILDELAKMENRFDA